MRALGLTDGSAGMNAQVQALAEAMGIECEMLAVKVWFPWRFLPNKLFDLGLSCLLPVTKQKISNIPDLIISCGRKGALVSVSLRNKVKRIHIQDPQMSPRHFDVVIAMAHD